MRGTSGNQQLGCGKGDVLRCSLQHCLSLFLILLKNGNNPEVHLQRIGFIILKLEAGYPHGPKRGGDS